jgi:hypothetical protein
VLAGPDLPDRQVRVRLGIDQRQHRFALGGRQCLPVARDHPGLLRAVQRPSGRGGSGWPAPAPPARRPARWALPRRAGRRKWCSSRLRRRRRAPCSRRWSPRARGSFPMISATASDLASSRVSRRFSARSRPGSSLLPAGPVARCGRRGVAERPSGPKSIPRSATGMGPRTAAPRPSARAGAAWYSATTRAWNTPAPVHFGTAGAVDRARQNAHRPYHAHPERFSHRPPPPAMPTQALTPELAVRNGRVVRRVDDPPSKGCFLIYDHTAENSSSWSTSE